MIGGGDMYINKQCDDVKNSRMPDSCAKNSDVRCDYVLCVDRWRDANILTNMPYDMVALYCITYPKSYSVYNISIHGVFYYTYHHTCDGVRTQNNAYKYILYINMQNTPLLQHTAFDEQTQSDVAVQEAHQNPPMWALILYNDDTTTMEFVVQVLVEIVNLPLQKAVMLMYQVHEQGAAKVAVYPKQIAQIKQQQIIQRARQSGFLLQVGIEPVDEF